MQIRERERCVVRGRQRVRRTRLRVDEALWDDESEGKNTGAAICPRSVP